MKPSKYLFALILTLILVLAVYFHQDTDRRIKSLEGRMNGLKGNFERLEKKSDDHVTFKELKPTKDRLAVYRSKVDNMILGYTTLDEILKNMFPDKRAKVGNGK